MLRVARLAGEVGLGVPDCKCDILTHEHADWMTSADEKRP